MRIGLVSSRSISYSRESNSINIPTGTDMKTGSHTCSDLACSGSVVGSSFRSVAGSGSESLTGSGGLRIRASSEEIWYWGDGLVGLLLQFIHCVERSANPKGVIDEVHQGTMTLSQQ